MFFVSNLAGLLSSRVHLGGTLGREDSGGLLLRSSIMTTATGILCTVSFKTGRADGSTAFSCFQSPPPHLAVAATEIGLSHDCDMESNVNHQGI
jgi:hypothetical protein